MKRYQFIAVDSVQAPKIYSIGFSDDTQVTRYGPAVRNQYIIHYVLSGKGIFNGQWLGAGEGFLITPKMREEYRPSTEEPWSFLWVISEDSSMEYFFEKHNANPKTGIFKFNNLYELNVLAEMLKTSTNGISASTQLSEIFLHIFHSCISKKPEAQSSAAKMYFEFSVNYIKSNLHLPITVEELCKTLGISQPYLYRIFKCEAGISPKQYISNCRLVQAKTLLANTSLSVSQISASVGFQNALEFSRFFSKQTGISPTMYSARYRKNYFTEK